MYTSAVEQSEASKNNILTTILKILAIIFIMVPTGSVMVGLFTATGVCIYLVIQGLPIIGVVIALFGLSLGSSWIFDIFNRLIFTRKKVHIALFFVSVITTIVGGIICMSTIFNFTFYNERPNVKLDNYKTTVEIDNKLYIRDMYKDDIIIDEEIPDDTAIISIDYYDDLNDIRYNDNSDNTIIELYAYPKNSIRIREMLKLLADNLKKRNIYNYGYLFKGEVTVKVNSNTKDKIIITN